MAAVVSFLTAETGGAGVQAVGAVRKMEVLTVPSTSTITANDGELAIIENTESTAILVAFGSTPDAQATTSTSATSAGLGIPAGLTSPCFVMAQGDKINVKVVP